MDKEWKNILDAIVETIKEAITVSAVEYGLSNSNLLKEIEVIPNYSTMSISLITPDYLQYVEAGSKKGSLKGVKVPTTVLIKWLKTKGVSGKLNNIAFAIQRKIYKVGRGEIKPRPFVSDALESVESEVAELLSIGFSDLIDSKLKKIK